MVAAGPSRPAEQPLRRGTVTVTVELVMAFEEEFDIEVPDEEAEKLQAVGDVVTYITSQQA